jgi:hypothetical protein
VEKRIDEEEEREGKRKKRKREKNRRKGKNRERRGCKIILTKGYRTTGLIHPSPQEVLAGLPVIKRTQNNKG